MNYSYHVRKAIHYVGEHYHEDITLATVAEYLGLNKCYFCTMFKSETGENFSNFLNQVRIDKGKELLTAGNLSMVDVAFSVGYSSQSYFNNVFKKNTGTTPRKFRDMQLGMMA